MSDQGTERDNLFAPLIQEDSEETSISFGDDSEFVSRHESDITASPEIHTETEEDIPELEASDQASPVTSDEPVDIDEIPGSAPDFSDLFDDERPQSMGQVLNDFSSPNQDGEQFSAFQKVLTDKPQPIFQNKNYYQVLLNGEGDISKRIHSLLGNFLKAEDPQDRSMHRGRLTPAYWDLAASIAAKITMKLAVPKIMLLRFGVLLPTAISAEQRMLISRIPFRSSSDTPVFYTDEWLSAVAFGRVNASATDETKFSGKNKGKKISNLLEKARGRYEAQIQVVKNHLSELTGQEKLLQQHSASLASHDAMMEYGNLPAAYNETQRASLTELSNIIRRLNSLNRQVSVGYNELAHIRGQLEKLQSEEQNLGDVPEVDSQALSNEVNSIRQMAKLCVGRQGNHFPMLLKQYFVANIRDIATRETVINTMAEIERLDPDIFKRTFKQQTNRIVPNIILIPCYGDSGICWEPFERHSRATSRGRLAIPMYPKDLRMAIISALGDLRWQVAKEKAQHYWMEEGLTGWYYQDFSDRKKKGDVKDAFVQDYILWMTKEVNGTQKLEREVRDIFWRYVPFPQDVKDSLRNRGFVYNELYKKDINRAASDGY